MNRFSRSMTYRLIMASSLWDAAYAALVTNQRRYAWGRVRRAYHSHYCDLLVDRLFFRDTLPTGAEFTLLDDWLVFGGSEQQGHLFWKSLPSESHLREGQLLAFFQAGLGTAKSDWIGFIVEQGETHPLDEVRLIGPEMPVFQREASRQLSPKVNHRWSRQVGALGERVFESFRNSKAMIIGAGRIGSLLAESLALAGIDELTIVDPDQLEIHNLNATVGSGPSDIGQSKVKLLLRHLNRIRPDILLKGIEQPANSPIVKEKAKEVDVIWTCLDDDEPRYEAAAIANRFLKIHIDVATIVRHAKSSTAVGKEKRRQLETRREIERASDQIESDQIETDDPNAYDRELGSDIRLFLPGCCIRCANGVSSASNNADSGAVNHVEGLQAESWRKNGRTGSLFSLNSIAVGCAVQVWYDFLAGKIRRSFWQRLRWNQGMGLEAVSGVLRPAPNCEICQKYYLQNNQRS